MTKTEFIITDSENRLKNTIEPVDIKLGNHPLSRVSSTESFGDVTDDRLNLDEHINSIVKKISRGIAGLREVRKFVSFSTMKILYNSLIQSLFDYCAIVWNNANLTHRYRLQKLQIRAVRVIKNLLMKYVPTTSLMIWDGTH